MLNTNLQINEITSKQHIQREKHSKNNEAMFSEQHIEAKEATLQTHTVHCQRISLMA
jgi:hypothetical protein